MNDPKPWLFNCAVTDLNRNWQLSRARVPMSAKQYLVPAKLFNHLLANVTAPCKSIKSFVPKRQNFLIAVKRPYAEHPVIKPNCARLRSASPKRSVLDSWPP